MLTKLVEHVVTKLVDQPNSVVINESVEGDVHVIKVTVAPEDLGKVIGKEGKTARALRTLLQAAAMNDGKKATLEILK